MAEDLLPILTRFHREVLIPDVTRIVGEAVDALKQRINTRFDEVNGHFDGIYQRFDRLETEYHMLVAKGQKISSTRSVRACRDATARTSS